MLRPDASRRAPRFMAQANANRIGEIHVYDVIGDSWFGITAKQVVEALDRFKAQGVEQLEVHVNSPGGSAYDGVAIFNALRRFEGQKTVYIDGLAASAASVIALAGDRIITGAGAMWMIHNPMNIAWGYASDLRKEADRLDALSESILQLYAGRTGQSREDLRAWMDAETWMDGKLALERGFTHATTDVPPAEGADESNAPADGAAEMSAMASSLLAQFKNAPPAVTHLLQSAPRPTAPAPTTIAPAGAEEEKPMKSLMKKLGLAENATEGEAMAALEKLQSESASASAERSEIMAATGAADIRSACATIAGLKERAARADELQAKLAAVESAKRQADVTAMLDEATKDGRLTPAKRAELTSDKAPAFASDPNALRCFLDCLPKAGPAPREPTEAPAAVVSDEARKAAALLGVDVKDLEKTAAAER